MRRTYLRKKEKLITEGRKIGNLYYLPIQVIKTPIYTIIEADKDTVDNVIWHQRLGHINRECMQKLQTAVTGIKNTHDQHKTQYLDNCEVCIKAKFTNKINHQTNNTKLEYLDKVSSDLCGPITPKTYDGYKYFVTFLDKATRYLEVQLLRTKDEAYNAFYEYKQKAENNKENKRIRIYATDNGGEFINGRFKRLLLSSGIEHQTSAPYTPEQNGLAERINRTLLNKMRAPQSPTFSRSSQLHQKTSNPHADSCKRTITLGPKRLPNPACAHALRVAQ